MKVWFTLLMTFVSMIGGALIAWFIGKIQGNIQLANVLIVNDIFRGGHTLFAASDFLKQYFPGENIRSATLICDEQANAKPTYYVALTNKTIRFDWKSYN
jgi:hypoxanthine phosphoribosyltransferase